MRSVRAPVAILACLTLVSVPGWSAAGAERLRGAIGEGSRPGLPAEIVFACRQPGAGGHWYENFGYYAHDPAQKAYRKGGRLARLRLSDGELTLLVDDPEGTVRDPQVSYDGRRVLFSWRRGGTEHFHLFEIGSDGAGLRQLTRGPWDDLEPTRVPDGGIIFVSSRCNRWVNCWYSPVAVLHRCEADGSGVRPLSANIEHDNTPWPLPDGRVIYERWEYVDRSRVAFHHLWSMNPDGTAQMVYYGNQRPGTLMIDAKPIPGTDRVVAIFSPGHGKREHAGAVTVVSSRAGPDAPASARRIGSGEDFRDPYPLDESRFLAARGASILLLEESGRARELYRLPEALAREGVECHEPRPLRPRPRERVIPPRVDRGARTGTLLLSDVNQGRRMEGVERGEIRSLLVLETLPKPVNFSGKMPPVSFGGTYTLERVLGTVPVEPDGSAYLELPAGRSLFLVALDAEGNSVQRMHSFLTVMPGETTSCAGCHEERTRAPVRSSGRVPDALRAPPRRIEPLEGIPEVFDFPRDIQPILDRHCRQCHDYDRREGGVILTGDRGPIFSHSYFTLTALGYVSDGRDRMRTNLPPRSVGTSASPLMRLVDGSHHGARLSRRERDLIRYWIESAAPYPGTYAALGTGMIGGFPKSRLDTRDRKWPESAAAAEAIERRCLGCHGASRPLPRYLSDNLGFVLSNPDFSDPRVRYSRHLLFNLTRPRLSLVLLAPLAREAGGYGTCRRPAGAEGAGSSVETKAVFSDRSDPDYRKILDLCRAGKRYLEKIGRFDMPGFRPGAAWVREMKRYGILPAGLPSSAPIDVYATERAYWRSLWWPRLDRWAPGGTASARGAPPARGGRGARVPEAPQLPARKS